MKASSDPNIAVGYVRVSTDDQSLGVQAQHDALAAWAAREGKHLAETFEDLGISGGAPIDKRPGLLSALEALTRHGAGSLVVARRDRLARDVYVAAMVERLCERVGVVILSADGMGNVEGPAGDLMRGMVAVFAQYERALIRARVKSALAVKRGRSERIGGIPYGSKLARDGVKLVESTEERGVLERILRLRSEGATFYEIAGALNESGVPSRGKRWYTNTVSRFVKKYGERNTP